MLKINLLFFLIDRGDNMMNRDNSYGDSSGRGSDNGYNQGSRGTNLQYHAGGRESERENKPKVKIYHMFNNVVKSFDGYIKLAKMSPEYAEEFIELADGEYKEAEHLMEIYQDMHQNSEMGSRSGYSMMESMNREIEKMERKIEEVERYM